MFENLQFYLLIRGKFLKTHFEICNQISRWLVPTGSEITPQQLNGGHGSSNGRLEKKKKEKSDKDYKVLFNQVRL